MSAVAARIHLRPWVREDAEALRRALRHSPDLETQVDTSLAASAERARRFIAGSLTFGAQHKNLAIIEEGQAVGNIGVSAIEWRHETAWVSYWLAAEVRGRGYATRSLASVANWAFQEGLFRLELGHRVNNPGSCRVAVAAGFTPEGVERLKLRYGAQRFDVETHSRLKTDPVPDLIQVPLCTSF